MSTSIPVGSPLAKKVFSVGLFTRVQQAPGFMNLLSGEMPKEGDFGAKTKGQTGAGYPVVKTGDLAKGSGDAVSIDLFNILQGKPTMGDQKIAGRMMGLTASSMDIRINQVRGGADSGGRMTQQRTVHNLRKISMAGLQAWMQRFEDQSAIVHLAGARGTQLTSDWVVPLASDPEFANIMVNTVKAPTKNRQYYANDATLPSDIGTNDALTLPDVSRIVSSLQESVVPLQPIKIDTDEAAWQSPLWCMFVTERQWLYLKNRTSQIQWNEAVKYAFERKSAAGGKRHPLFDSFETIMWDGMLIKRMHRYAVRFATGATVTYDTGGTDGGTYTEATATTAVDVDRAIIVGAQALGKAYGRSSQSDYFYDWNEEKVDHGNSVETVVSAMCGTAKVRFRIDGLDTDHGVAVIDSYAPDPNSSAGRTLLAS